MIPVLIALAAFFVPIGIGFLAPWHTPAVWLMASLGAIIVCTYLNQPLAFAASIQTIILAVIAVGVCPPPPSRRLPRWQRQQLREFRRDLEAFGHRDLEHAEMYDPKPGDKRVA